MTCEATHVQRLCAYNYLEDWFGAASNRRCLVQGIQSKQKKKEKEKIYLSHANNYSAQIKELHQLA